MKDPMKFVILNLNLAETLKCTIVTNFCEETRKSVSKKAG